VQLAGIDLNLLVLLDALLAERSVTLAARRVGLSPSAMSHALARLRELFDDALLVRTGQGMAPTPRALAIQRHVRHALAEIQTALDEGQYFEPARSRRLFRLRCTDDLQAAVLPRLLRRLSAEAPEVRIETSGVTPTSATFQALAEGDLDLAVGQFGRVPHAMHQELLFETRIVCLVRRGHPRIRRRLTLDDFVREGCIAIAPQSDLELPFFVDRLLHEKGLRRRIVAYIQNLELAPLIVSRTDFLCNAAEQMVLDLVDELPLRIFPNPLGLPDQQIHLIWHHRLHDDPAHRWFREMLRESGRRPAAERRPGARRSRHAAPDTGVAARA